ncbi:hypothetical protein JTB14_013620 [Gonioctena quinquepunctata]|nr:hypothetical protein JTB14_013620 [Gonioctena quinquepunctata]
MEHIRFDRGFSLQEALDMAYSEDIDAIYVEPPESTVLTDGDSGDEDSGGTIDNLSGRQLRAQAEVRFVIKENMTAEPDLPTFNKLASTSSHHPSSEKKYSWISGDLQAQTRYFLEPDFKQYMDLSPVQLFELFFDHEMITFLIEESSRYALFKNLPNPNISKGDMNNTLVCGAMRRDRFVQIMRVLHCADNSKPNLGDKVWKLRPFINKLKSKYVEHYQPEKHMNYDESMMQAVYSYSQKLSHVGQKNSHKKRKRYI